MVSEEEGEPMGCADTLIPLPPPLLLLPVNVEWWWLR